MRRTLLATVALAICLFRAGPGQAGLYHPAEPDPRQAGLYRPVEADLNPDLAEKGVKALPFSAFRDLLTDLQKIPLEQPVTENRTRYLKRCAELQGKGNLRTVAERVNLGAYLIRLRRYDDACAVLEAALNEDRRNFMVLANLATAHHLAGRLDRATGYQEQVRDFWPSEWPGLTKEQLAWYSKVERSYLKLLRLRIREAARQQGGRPPPLENVDDIFGIRFAGESGKYEAGQLAAAERAKLPPEAMALVQQLLIWLPDDIRLYWLAGELFNAQGEIEGAETILGKLRNDGISATELREHRQVLLEAKAEVARKKQEEKANATPSWMPSTWQLAVVGGGVGLLIAALAWFQLREVIRRCRGTTPPANC